nr:S-layer homology domain-containing protein [Paenibacillus anseongense]
MNDSGTLQTIKNSKYNPTNGTVDFYPKHFSKYAAALGNATFQDLSDVAWAKPGIEGLAVREVVNGVGEGRFSPNGQVTRAQFIQMLTGALDVEDDKAVAIFTDVSAGAWYYKAIATAQSLGIVNGREDGSFGIDAPVSRQEMAAMMHRAVKARLIVLPSKEAVAAFKDQEAIASYAAEAVPMMQQTGMINGFNDGTFAPEAYATRAQAAVMIYRLFKQI